jgi:hypothetical protein
MNRRLSAISPRSPHRDRQRPLAFFAFEPHCTRGVATVKGSHILNRSQSLSIALGTTTSCSAATSSSVPNAGDIGPNVNK